MNVGLSTSVIQRGRSGVAQYVFALLRALVPYAARHRFTLFVLKEDLPLFAFVESKMKLVPVSERFRPPVNNILWHQLVLPRLARQHQLRSEEHTSELQSRNDISYAVFCLKKKKK